ncbi:twin transmembrane helix small protein [Breoghania sp. L-A4]|uniref:twin transmembrane helix small protein n=1 Tax=Breoghania sp. L-A4 TaxID=2304600 RepID=UPI000E35E8E2|nr:twin transmembrane helix small protein [Breoghania sp. L-A4]AXS38737.1 twin transmembrane helix small protein [Breoghania sp. L-A4]
MGTILYNLIPVAMGLVALVLIAGLWNMMRGGSSSRSQKLMRARVLLQFITIVIVMAAVYFIKQ